MLCHFVFGFHASPCMLPGTVILYCLVSCSCMQCTQFVVGIIGRKCCMTYVHQQVNYEEFFLENQFAIIGIDQMPESHTELHILDNHFTLENQNGMICRAT